MRVSCAAAVAIFLVGCAPEPDLVLPLRPPIPIVPETPRQERKVAAPATPEPARTDQVRVEPLSALLQPSPLKFERRKPRLSGAGVDRLFESLLERRRSIYKYFGRSGCGEHLPGLSWTVSQVLLQANLFSDLYPEEAQRLAMGLLQDEEGYPYDLWFALQLIKPDLAAIPADLESLLLRIGEHHEDWIARDALHLLCRGGPIDRYRPLLRRLCLEGREEAFDLLSRDPDEETARFLKELSQSDLGRGTWMQWAPFRARLVLDRLALLEAPDWRVRIEAILRGPTKEVDLDETQEWALSVAFTRHPASAFDWFHRSVERMRKILEPKLQGSASPFGEDGTLPSKEFGLWWARIPGADVDFDLTLIDYALLGGSLKVWEARRLEYFGYLGDREGRLQEMLQPGFRW